MNTINRRTFLKNTSLALGGLAFITPRVFAIQNSSDLPDPDQIVFRFVVGGDLHYGRPNSDYVNHTRNMVRAFNSELETRGLDFFMFNGDSIHDDPYLYDSLMVHLKNLKMPVYASKGNHDFLREDQSWEKIWGHPENHVVELGDKAIVIGDTSIGENMRSHFSAADKVWIKKALEGQKDKKNVFVMLHIAQRSEGVEKDGYVWPRAGVGAGAYGQKVPSNAEDGEAVMAIIESYPNVTATFHGHNHFEIEQYLSGGKPYFFCSRLGHERGNKIGYRVVEQYKNGTFATYMWNLEDNEIMNQHTIRKV